MIFSKQNFKYQSTYLYKQMLYITLKPTESIKDHIGVVETEQHSIKKELNLRSWPGFG